MFSKKILIPSNIYLEKFPAVKASSSLKNLGLYGAAHFKLKAGSFLTLNFVELYKMCLGDEIRSKNFQASGPRSGLCVWTNF